MFFGRRKSVPSQVTGEPNAAASAPAPQTPAETGPTPPDSGTADAARDILELIEIDLISMVRKVEEAASAVRSGAGATETALAAIRERTGDLGGRIDTAQSTTSDLQKTADMFAGTAQQIGEQVRAADSLTREAGDAAGEASASVVRLRESSSAIGNVVDLISAIARQTSLLALNSTIEAARAGAAGRGFAVVAQEVKALALQTQEATEDIRKKIETLQSDAGASVAAVERIAGAIDQLKPVFESVSGAMSEQNASTATLLHDTGETAGFIASVSDGASQINAAAEEAMTHGAGVSQAGDAVFAHAEKLKARCTILLHQNDIGDRRKHERLPCLLKVEIRTADGIHGGTAYDLSMGGMLIKLPDHVRIAENDTARLTIAELGECAMRVVERSAAGVQVEFQDPPAAMLKSIEDKLWSIREDNSEFVARALESAKKITQIVEGALRMGHIKTGDIFDTEYAPIPGTDPQQFSTRALGWLEKVLPDILEPLLATDARMTFCAAVDRNGYLPVHNRIYSQPQRPSDATWNQANCRNRRIFDDRAGLAAARNTRAYLIQSYPRDMGNGTIVMMREIDVPLRFNGAHWGALRTAYKL